MNRCSKQRLNGAVLVFSTHIYTAQGDNGLSSISRWRASAVRSDDYGVSIVNYGVGIDMSVSAHVHID